LALSSFVKQFYPQFRSMPGLASQTVGYDVNKMTTTAGTVDFKPNLFLRPRALANYQGANANVPSTAGVSLALTVAGTDGNLPAGAYRYKVTFCNDFGESAPVQDAAAATVTVASEHVVLTLTGAPACKYIKVFRTVTGGAVGTEKFVGNYKYTSAGMAVNDMGVKLPGLGEAFLLDMSAECMRFKQLSPLSKINFAIVTTALEFAVVLYGALFVYTPRFNCLFQNTGK